MMGFAVARAPIAVALCVIVVFDRDAVLDSFDCLVDAFRFLS